MVTGSLLAVTLVAPGAGPVTPPDAAGGVAKGLEWLAAKQDPTGFWAGADGKFKVLSTSAAGLALLMEGSTPKEGRYAEHLRRAVAWFEGVAQPDGSLVPPGDDFETPWAAGVHADALLFLASAYDADDDGPRRTRLRTLVAAAVAHAVKGQTDRGAWGDARGGGEADDTQLTAGVLHALAAARAAGVEVPAAVFERAARYYAAATTTEGGVTYSLSAVRPGGARAGVTNPVSTALAAASFLTASRRPPELRRWVAAAGRTMPAVPGSSRPGGFTSSVAFMLQSLAFARVAHALGDDGYRSLVPGGSAGGAMRWSAHRERLFPCVRGAQSPDGSWADASFGPARATALALIILQLDNNYLPAFSR